jgi:signal transduction histidine kinase
MDQHPHQSPSEHLATTFLGPATKANKIIRVLMDRVEHGIDSQGNAYSLFQAAIVLEDKIRERTRTLEQAMRQLEQSNRELSKAKQQTEAVHSRLKEVIESISEGFAHFDQDDRLVLCNSRFLELWPGIGAVARPGVRFEDVSRWTVEHGLIAGITASDSAWLEERLRHHRHPTDPIVIRLATGRWLQVRERAVRDGGIVGIYTDISELKDSEERRHEQALAEKSILLQSTLDNLDHGVSVFDRDLRLVAWNDRFLTLLDLPDWLVQAGASFADYLRFRAARGDYGEDPATAVALRLEMARQHRPFRTNQVRPDGTVIEVRRDPMPGGGFVTSYADITESLAASEQLREAKASLERRVVQRTAELTKVNQMLRQEISERTKIEEALRIAKADAEQANLSKTKFIASASHDLLQPLNAARLFVTALSERPLGDKEGEFVSRIDTALRNVEALLGTILDISKFDAGVVPAQKSSFFIHDLLESLASEYGPVAADAGLRLRVRPCAAIVRSDPSLLARILRNFVSNAIRYTRTGGIVIGCRLRGDHVRIETWDSGIGIPADRIEEIFGEFRQLAAHAAGRDKGFGLGLAIVKRIARILDHPIGVRSWPNRGSVFAIEVPAGDPDRVITSREPRRPLPTDSVANAVVAVIENEETVTEGMRELLEGWGCGVITGATGDAVIRRIQGGDRRPDILIADYHLDEGRTGLAAIDQICRTMGRQAPAIVITADRSPDVLDRVRARGLHLLNKPIRPAKLRALMSHMLS